MQTVLPILNRHGVVLVQTTTGDDDLITRLVHAESGEHEESVDAAGTRRRTTRRATARP